MDGWMDGWMDLGGYTFRRYNPEKRYNPVVPMDLSRNAPS